ncbi:MAG: hypothetical protein GWO82_03660 [Bacteroidetes bacterium]|nr:hypothetical protein [Bacteroidota bacterium]
MKLFAKRAVSQQLHALKNRTAFKPKATRRLVFIHETDLDITEAQFEDMCCVFSPEFDTIEYIHYNANKKMLEGVPKPHLHPQSLDWRGRVTADDLVFVLEQQYDLVVHFVHNITLPLVSFSAQLKASFRIGPSSLDTRLNDLVLPSTADFGTFLSDLKQYFNKIQSNERT